ncbi:MAG: MOSC domain-containing protein [Gammaproteobacteria bacterium]|nr:MOSC domain-containing protein [Gammaproteobacteria bacterium]
MQSLMQTYAQDGRLEWIGIRPLARGDVELLQTAKLIATHGIEGDHTANRAGSKRQVTLIQAEHLLVIAALCGRDQLDPALLRRNLVVSRINLLTLKQKRFLIGDVELEYTDSCPPCSRMEDNLGKGGYNAMRGHGGITARVLNDGDVRVGDVVRAKAPDSNST